MRYCLKAIVYFLLISGAVVFSFPFLWMAATSVKVDRELQTREFRLMPMTPRAQAVSPYVDDERYTELEGPYQAELLPKLQAAVDKSGFAFPAEVNRTRAAEQVARGLYDKLRKRLPEYLWRGRDAAGHSVGSEAAAVAALAAAAEQEITPDMVGDIFANVYRRLCMGAIRLRTYDRKEVELGAAVGGASGPASAPSAQEAAVPVPTHVGVEQTPAQSAPAKATPISARLDNATPDVVSVRDVRDGGEDFALLRYDFAHGDRFTLSRTYDVPADVDLDRLHRIAVQIRPDDTWHELWMTMEKGGVRYLSRRCWPLGNYEVITAAWQQPGPDDASTKIKTWTIMDEVARGPGVLADPHKIKLTFEVRRCGQGGAWWNKIALNYNKVLDHIPFWRYLRVSLFLVVANIVLTVIFSSLVAYSFARLNWPGREFCFVLMLATMMIPSQVIMIPQFLIWKNVGLYDSLAPLWLGPVFGNAFFIFLLRQFLKGVPRDLEDAARIDGCGFLRIYWHIMLPLIKPSLAAIAIFTFMGTWNDFMGPLIYIADQRLYPLAFGLYAFAVQVNNNPALTMAGSFLMTVPVIVIFFFAQKYFIQGVTLTGIKG
jgi:ABC-type glycerol-3-phosphate transport system permease component